VAQTLIRRSHAYTLWWHDASYGSLPPYNSSLWANHLISDSWEEATHILSGDMTHPMGFCPPIIRVSQPRIYSLPKPTDRTHKGVCLLRNALWMKVLPTFIHIGTRWLNQRLNQRLHCFHQYITQRLNPTGRTNKGVRLLRNVLREKLLPLMRTTMRANRLQTLPTGPVAYLRVYCVRKHVYLTFFSHPTMRANRLQTLPTGPVIYLRLYCVCVCVQMYFWLFLLSHYARAPPSNSAYWPGNISWGQ